MQKRASRSIEVEFRSSVESLKTRIPFYLLELFAFMTPGFWSL